MSRTVTLHRNGLPPNPHPDRSRMWSTPIYAKSMSFEILGAQSAAELIFNIANQSYESVVKTITDQTQGLADHIYSNKLSGQIMGVRSGALRESLNAEVNAEFDRVEGVVSVDTPYARIHEYGGMTRPHPIKPKYKPALRFFWPKINAWVFAPNGVNHPGSHIKEKSFMRGGLMEWNVGNRLQGMIAEDIVRTTRQSHY
jgi:phage gpG-like protein